MIDVQDVLKGMPHFERFCSVDSLRSLVESLRIDGRFKVDVAGTSVGGEPIYHVCFGRGPVKAMFVAGPHCPEPIGSLTVYGLLVLLRDGAPTLESSGVEWHIVPCIDPDGALLNEGWTQRPFTAESYVRNYYVQIHRDQVDFSFPIRHKRIVFTQPSREARVLQALLDRIRPDFLYTLHNTQVPAGGTWYAISRDIEATYYDEMSALLERHGIPVQAETAASTWFCQFHRGVSDMPSVRKYYDFLENRGLEIPKVLLDGEMGASSYDYLAEIKESALSFCMELTYLKHPSDVSKRTTSENLRELKRRINSDNMRTAEIILGEWKGVEAFLDRASPFYRKIFNELIAHGDRLHSGAASTWGSMQTPEVLNNPDEDRPATEAERFYALVGGRLLFLCHAYGFVRLLKASRQTATVARAIDKFEQVFDAALEELGNEVDFASFEVIDHDTLARVQLGSGLIALNSLLHSRGATATQV